VVVLEKELIGTEPIQAVSPAETKPESHPSVPGARDSKRSDCQWVGGSVAAAEQSGRGACTSSLLTAMPRQLHACIPGVLRPQRDD